MIDTSTTEGKIAVMQAFADGKQIEFRYCENNKWRAVVTPAWAWDEADYRIYEEPVILDEIPWDVVNPIFKWHAFDFSGVGYFYTDKPSLLSTGWSLRNVSSFASSRALKIKRGNQPWDKSLIERPKDV